MPNPLTYSNTKVPDINGWMTGEPSLANQPRGISYETSTHFIHFYARDNGWYTVSPGLTATEKKQGKHQDWLTDKFGAEGTVELKHEVGTVTKGVWRPGLLYEDQIYQSLNTTKAEQRLAEQSLYILIHRLFELLLYIEPGVHGLNTYSLKTRELLILACTEIEAAWSYYLKISGVPIRSNGFNTNDYVKLATPLSLMDYQITLSAYPLIDPYRPFKDWQAARPTASLVWYDAYNKTKHDRAQHLDQATLQNCIEAVAANIALYCVRFSPYPLFTQSTPVSSLVQHLFDLELINCDPTTFYIPLVKLPVDHTDNLVCFDSTRLHAPWKRINLILST